MQKRRKSCWSSRSRNSNDGGHTAHRQLISIICTSVVRGRNEWVYSTPPASDFLNTTNKNTQKGYKVVLGV
jgi:hypothetical protein